MPGEDLHLNIDLGLMEFIHRIFPPTHTGAVVMMNVADGCKPEERADCT